MQYRDWNIIKVLSVEKNITRTAQLLYMSQPALTSRIRQIEKRFGVEIIHRSNKGIELTEEGLILSEAAEDFMGNFENLKDLLQTNALKTLGSLKIAATNYFTLNYLPTLLSSFAKQYPNAKYKITTDWSKNIFNTIHTQKAHIGFVSVNYGGFKNIHLLYEDPICVAYFKEFALEDLPKLPRITYQSDYLIQSQLDKWWRNNFNKPPFIGMQVDKLNSTEKMVANGLGYAFLPKKLIQDMPNIYYIPIQNKNGQIITRKTWMIHNNEATRLNIVDLFINHVKSTKLEF